MLGCGHDDAATDHPPTRSAGPQGARPPPPLAAPDRAPAARSGDRHRARHDARHEHRRDELPPPQARLGRPRRGDRWTATAASDRWRAATEMHGWTERDVDGDPDAKAATDWLRRYYLRGFVERYERWLDEQAAWPLDWQDAAGASDFALRLSPAGLAAFNADIEALYERYRGAPAADDRPTPIRARDTTRPGLRPRLPARARPDDDRPRRARRAPPLPGPHRAALAADRPAHPDQRPARPVARAVADRDRPRLQPPGPGRAVPRAADRRPVRCARPAARADRREPGRARRRWACCTSPTRSRCSPR